jgi:hypothetical protein
MEDVAEQMRQLSVCSDGELSVSSALLCRALRHCQPFSVSCEIDLALDGYTERGGLEMN